MFLLDVNVVLAIHRGDHSLHEVASRRFDETLAAGRDGRNRLLVLPVSGAGAVLGELAVDCDGQR